MNVAYWVLTTMLCMCKYCKLNIGMRKYKVMRKIVLFIVLLLEDNFVTFFILFVVYILLNEFLCLTQILFIIVLCYVLQ